MHHIELIVVTFSKKHEKAYLCMIDSIQFAWFDVYVTHRQYYFYYSDHAIANSVVCIYLCICAPGSSGDLKWSDLIWIAPMSLSVSPWNLGFFNVDDNFIAEDIRARAFFCCNREVQGIKSFSFAEHGYGEGHISPVWLPSSYSYVPRVISLDKHYCSIRKGDEIISKEFHSKNERKVRREKR